ARCSLIKRFENLTMSMKRTWASSNSVSFVASLDIVLTQKGVTLDQCEGVVAFCAATSIEGASPQYDFGLICLSGHSTAPRGYANAYTGCMQFSETLRGAVWL